jgi:glycerol-3-phosphate acyltransferase PlsX
MERIRLAVDAESGDFGAEIVIAGIVEALQRSETRFRVFLCGNKGDIERILRTDTIGAGRFKGDIDIVHCPDRVTAHEQRRIHVWKEMRNASIIRCITLQKEGRVDASISAGDTAILLGGALFILGRRKNALRPALAAFLPTTEKRGALLLDVGANLNCRKEHLVSFAIMGREYLSAMGDNAMPKVALLNIGSEQIKGTNVIGETDKILRRKCPGYAGYIEANQVFFGGADVIVSDGFVGNVLLKTGESFHTLIKSVLNKKPSMLAGLKEDLAILDAENYGAVPFLGIKGIVLKAHGGSSPRAIASALLAAEAAVLRNKSNGIFA